MFRSPPRRHLDAGTDAEGEGRAGSRRVGPGALGAGVLAAALAVVTAFGVSGAAAPAPAAADEPTVTTTAEGHPVKPSVAARATFVPTLRLEGQGWGHSTGMSQIGAQAQALEGRSAVQILTHYFPGTEVTTDARASTERIRVNVVSNVSSTPVTAIDGQVTWQVCTPVDSPIRNARVPADACDDWFVQSRGQELRVRPLTGTVATPNGTQSHDPQGALVTVAEPDTAIDAPASGILIERLDGTSWTPYRAYRTPDDGRPAAQLPVARAVHGGDRIEAQTYPSDPGSPPGLRRYAHGWRDIHLVREGSAPNHRYGLTAIQDVDDIEHYLQGLVEVATTWPAAALESQVITARTYALRSSMGSCLCDILATPRSQVFRGVAMVEAWRGERWQAAIDATTDQVLTYQGELAHTYYSSSFGGRSENVEDSWAYYRAWQNLSDDTPEDRKPPPYLRSVDDPWSLATEAGGQPVGNSRRSWTAEASNRELTRLINRDRSHLGLSAYVEVERARIGERTDGGTPRTLEVTGTTRDGDREDMTFEGIRTNDGRTLARPIAGATLRLELPLVAGGEAGNGRLSSSQLTRIGYGPFPDADNSTHALMIAWASEAGLTEGRTATTYEPSVSVSRGQMASFLTRTFAVPPAPTGSRSFSDVPPGSTHHAAIEALADARIVEGRTDGTFGPHEAIDRAEFAVLLQRTMGLVPSGTARFGDIPATGTVADAVDAVFSAGITTGCTTNRYCPDDPVTRGQVASFFARAVRG